jgi:hypothetical protein
MTRRSLGAILGAIVIGAVACVPSALADGLPVPGVVTPDDGVPGPHGTRYVTDRDHGSTVVRELGLEGTLRSRRVSGNFTVPAIALDGSPAGLSADGNTLALIEPRHTYPQQHTHLLVMDARRLRVAQRIDLGGDFSFDAISPDGSTLYLIEYLAPHDPTRYAVRAYDLSTERLAPAPIVDPDEPPGEMRGYPMTRVTSVDGRWAYTLYDGGGDEPFVHALDTSEGRAVCVDLDGLVKANEVSRVSMTLGSEGGELTLTRNGKALAIVDTQALEAARPSAVQSGGGDAGGVPWMVIGIALALGLGAGAAVILGRHRRTSGAAAPGA